MTAGIHQRERASSQLALAGACRAVLLSSACATFSLSEITSDICRSRRRCGVTSDSICATLAILLLYVRHTHNIRLDRGPGSTLSAHILSAFSCSISRFYKYEKACNRFRSRLSARVVSHRSLRSVIARQLARSWHLVLGGAVYWRCRRI